MMHGIAHAESLLERAAKIWQTQHPKALPIVFVCAAGEFVARHLSQVAPEVAVATFDAFVGVMRESFLDHLKHRRAPK